ncbi:MULTISPECIES: flagellar basal body-associated FliL family protein [unclassified Nitrospirillum]|uniref:flagellar basal body-associated FliL family protein n=1 Tax=unclassified Nitrospirillum TaxID=2627523 RepID=UPI002ACA1058|nr:flagellar basal body-associated FliL family protein [Nitrospirillum sp. BR 11828]MDZ5648197.1 flagellar basal body-associated FliL family protein [Nitrospirillum sp. BR 11828]MEE3625309.1 flagellar basal body-associated FliL family protein [Nitrospirillum sp. BR 11752]
MTAIETDGGGEQELPRKKFSGKKIVMWVVVPLLLIALIAGGLIFSGLLDGLLGKKKAEEVEEKPAAAEEAFDPKAPPVFFPLGELLINLQTNERRPAFLKLKIQLEIYKEEDKAKLTVATPRIIDTFQTYLRELRLDDLKGSAGIYRLREELLQRVNAAAAPVRVRDVLFEEILVQSQ